VITGHLANIHADLPDLTDEVNLSELDRWEGSWSYLSNLKWVRITDVGAVRTSSFPPKN
jgi:translation machinery-associated protein 16